MMDEGCSEELSQLRDWRLPMLMNGHDTVG
jgi:hypothetical protein